jgi:hypothetical protein
MIRFAFIVQFNVGTDVEAPAKPFLPEASEFRPPGARTRDFCVADAASE